MRKTWCLVWAALLALMLSSSCALAEIDRGTCGESLTWVLADNGTLTISGSGAMTDWDSADTEWSNYNERLVKVVIEEGVTSIGRNAFCYMSMLTEAQIASTVVSIEASAFAYCSSLASVTGASGVKTIGDDAFTHCSALAAYPFAQGLQSIGSCAFDTSGLLSANLPDSVTSIGDAALYGTPLTSVTLPQGLTSIPSSLLQMCGSLRQVTVPAGVTSIGENAFNCCTSAQITLPDNVATIGEAAFNAAGGIVCGLGSVTAKALSACGEGYYYSTPENPDLRFYDEEGEIILQSYAGAGGDVTIPSGVTVIQLSAFEDCSTVTGVTIPDTVKTIRAWAFKGCTGLKRVTVPASVTAMFFGVFEGCSALQSATLLASLEEIPENAFVNCTSLESVTLPAGVTALGAGMFSGCSKLKDVTLPSGLTEIPANAFTGCAALTSLPLPAGVTEIGAEAFKDCTGLTAVDIPAGMSIIWTCAYRGCTSAVITLPDNVSLYGDALTGVKQIICNPNTKTARGLSQAPFTMKGNPAFTLKQADANYVEVVSYTGSRENVVVPEGITEWRDTETIYVNLRLQRTPSTNGAFSLRAKNVTIPDGVTSLPSTQLYDTEKLYLPDSLPMPAETLQLYTAPTIYCSADSDAYAWYRDMEYRIVTTDSGTPVLSLKDATELVMDVGESRTIAADSFTLMPLPADYRGELTLEVVSGSEFIKAEGDTLTGVKSGSAQLRATVDGQYTCTVPVRVCPEVTSFFLSGQVMAKRGGEFQMWVFGLAPSGVSGRLTWYMDGELVYTGTDDVVTLTAPTAKDQETTTVRVVAPGGLTRERTIELHDSVSEPYLLSSTVELFDTVQICVDVDGKQRINDPKTFSVVSYSRDRLEFDVETETLKTKKRNETDNLDQNEGEAMFTLMSVTGKQQDFTITVQCTQHADTARYDEQPPTCLYAGFKAHYHCKNCGKFRLDQEGSQWIPPVWEEIDRELGIPPINHANKTLIEASDPTCTTPGYSEHYDCDNCDLCFVKAEDGTFTEVAKDSLITAQPTGHLHTMLTEAVPETCTTAGNSAYYTCDDCGMYFVKNTDGSYTEVEENSWVIPKIDHAHKTLTEAVPETCTTAGNSAYYTCDDCGLYFVKNADGSFTQVEKDSWVIPATHVHHLGENGACRDCGARFAMTGLILPNSLDSIGEEAFIGSAAQAIVVPKTCTSIGERAFADCTALQLICLPAALEGKLPENLFEGLETLPEIVYY